MDLPDEALLMLLTGCCLLKWIHQPKWIPFSVLKNPLFFLVVIQWGWTAICCAYALDSWIAVKFLLAKTWYIFPFVLLPQVLFRSSRDILRLALCMGIPMLLVVVQSLLRHAAYGFSFGGVKETLWPFFRNHVVYSAMLVCITAICWGLLRTETHTRYRRWLRVAIILCLVALFLSYSRGAWAALLVGVVTAVVMYRRWLRQTLVIVCLGAACFTGWLLYHDHYVRFIPDYTHTIFHTDFEAHLAATVSLKDVSDAERFYRWVAGVKMVIARPVTGFGPNNFYGQYRSYTAGAFKTWVSNNPDHSSVHNYFLLTALEQGVPGLLILIALVLSVLLTAQRLMHTLQNHRYRVTAWVTGIVFSMVITVNLLSDLVETDKIGSLFWLCIGMLIWLNGEAGKEKKSLDDEKPAVIPMPG